MNSVLQKKENDKVTYEDAIRLFRYENSTGKIYWLNPSYGANIGKEAGCKKSDSWNSYLSVSIKDREYKVHRIVWLMNHGDYPDGCIDHKDGNGLNNRVENLRVVSDADNQRNSRKKLTNKSGITGVIWHKKK